MDIEGVESAVRVPAKNKNEKKTIGQQHLSMEARPLERSWRNFADHVTTVFDFSMYRLSMIHSATNRNRLFSRVTNYSAQLLNYCLN